MRQTPFCQSKHANKYQWQFFDLKRQATFTVFIGIQTEQNNNHDLYLWMAIGWKVNWIDVHRFHRTIINKPQTSFDFTIESESQAMVQPTIYENQNVISIFVKLNYKVWMENIRSISAFQIKAEENNFYVVVWFPNENNSRLINLLSFNRNEAPALEWIQMRKINPNINKLLTTSMTLNWTLYLIFFILWFLWHSKFALIILKH